MIAANWKMNKTPAETKDFIDTFNKQTISDNVDVVICAPFTSLSVLKNSKIQYGAQNIHFEESGAFTGEVSAAMIKDLGCAYVLIGHSDRRHIFSETNEEINKKIKKALEYNLKVIFCIGETHDERQANKTEEIIKTQLKIGLKDIPDIQEIVIAYEPVWAISRGDPNAKPATKEDAKKAHKMIREFLSSTYNQDTAEKTRILYGGSVKPDNIKELMQQEDIDGALVGGASLDPESFAKICNF